VSTARESQGAESGRVAARGTSPHRRGPVLEVLRKLRVEGGTEESAAEAVLALVAKLVARNSELEQRLAKVLLSTVDEGSAVEIGLAGCRVTVLQSMASPS